MRPQRYVHSWQTHKAAADKAASAAESARRTANQIRAQRVAGGAR